MLAELSDTGWWVVGGIATMVVKEVLDWVKTWLKERADVRRAKALQKSTEEAAAKLAKVTQAEGKKVTDHLERQDQAVEVIRKENNGMKDQLVKEVRDAAFASGVKSETDKEKQ